MIATSPKVAYIHEPFNVKHDIGICRARFDYWFTYVSKHNEQEYYGPINDTLNFRYNLADKLRSNKHPLHIVRQLKRYVLLSRHRWLHRRPLIKDPIALFSAEWLSSSFNMDTVVLIRHPAAFAGSLKVMNWIYPFSHFIKQPILIRDRLRIFEDEIRDYSTNEKDIIDQAGLLLWKSGNTSCSL